MGISIGEVSGTVKPGTLARVKFDKTTVLTADSGKTYKLKPGTYTFIKVADSKHNKAAGTTRYLCDAVVYAVKLYSKIDMAGRKAGK